MGVKPQLKLALKSSILKNKQVQQEKRLSKCISK